MRILGVDPGTRLTGVGIIETAGTQYQLLHYETVSIPQKLPIAQRLLRIHQALRSLIERYRPQVLAIENVFYGKDVQALVRIGEARSCAMIAASELGVDVVEYPPARIKQAVSGNGQASKEQVQHMIKTLLNLKSLPPSDSADALAVAICHFHAAKSRSLTEKLFLKPAPKKTPRGETKAKKDPTAPSKVLTTGS